MVMKFGFERFKEYFDLCQRLGIRHIPYKLLVGYDGHWEEVKKIAELKRVCTCCGISVEQRIRVGHDEECIHHGVDPKAACFREQRGLK